MRKNAQTDKSIVLFPMNNGGAGHFYHYILGYLMPIVTSPDRTPGRFSVVSVGLLDRITREVFADEVDIVQHPTMAAQDYPKLRDRLNKLLGGFFLKRVIIRPIVKRSMSSALKEYTPGRLLMLESFDNPLRYQSERISVFRDFVEKRLADRIETVKKSADKPDILLIDRAPPHSHYADVGRSSGSQRRSIPNINSLCELLNKHRKTEIFHLEDKDLALQIAAFSEANVVVAQHGAALTNIIWMRPGSLVVEIIPPDKVAATPRHEYFSLLAKVMNVRHQYIFQDHDHAELTASQMQKIESVLDLEKV
ncbi:MAG: glycosyltransferase family 61 protein [Anderseniella sp.]